MLALRAVDNGLDHLLGKTKDYNISIYSYHVTLRAVDNGLDHLLGKTKDYNISIYSYHVSLESSR